MTEPELIDDLHCDIERLETQLAASTRTNERLEIAVAAEREIVDILVSDSSNPRCETMTAIWRGQIIDRITNERTFAREVQAYVANQAGVA